MRFSEVSPLDEVFVAGCPKISVHNDSEHRRCVSNTVTDAVSASQDLPLQRQHSHNSMIYYIHIDINTYSSE